MLKVKVADVEYTDFVSIEYDSSIVNFNNQCAFTIALQFGESPPFFANDDVTVSIDDEVVITGYIYKAQVSYGPESHSVSYVATDDSIDFADSQIDVISDLASSINLVGIIEKVLAHIGSSVKVVDNTVSGIKNFSENEDRVSPDVGSGCFEYCDGLCLKRQVLMRTTADGNIELTRNSGDVYTESLLNLVGDTDGNNIQSGNYTYDISSSFSKYVVKSNKSSKSNFSLADSATDDAANDSLANQSGQFEDTINRPGRQMVVLSQEASTDADNTEQAKWFADDARATKIAYSVVIPSHVIGNEIVKQNKLVRVVDEFTGVADYMLIESVMCTTDLDGADISTLTLVDKNSFTLDLSDPSRRFNTSEEEAGFSLGG